MIVMPGIERFHAAREQLRADYAAIPPGEPVRLAKKTSNLFRVRAATAQPGLDVSAFSGVLSIDPVAKTADVLGMTTYEDLVEATLPFAMMPLVVPQLKTITLGGAVTGLGIESSSFRNGCPHESVLEMEILTGDGQIVVATADNEHRDLFHGFPNSYGTLGYALRLTIELEQVEPFVELRHIRFGKAEEYFAAVERVVADSAWDGAHVDFVDGTVFGEGDHVMTLGRFVSEAPYVSDYTGNQIYYRSQHDRSRDYLTVHDYLWRWDTDWFWCSRALGVQHPLIRPLIPRRYLRSDTYWKLVGFERRHGYLSALQRRRGQPEREAVIQDVEIPISRAPEFLERFHEQIGIAPVWMCPLRNRGAAPWDLYRLDPSTTYVNFGFWSSVALEPGESDGTYNRIVERLVADLGGRKSLYSSSCYEEDEFWATYNGETYDVLKKTYDSDGRLLDLYAKCVRSR